MKNVLFSICVNHLLSIGEELPFLPIPFGVAPLSKAVVVGHRTDPTLGNIFTLRVTFALPFLITNYVFINNHTGDGEIWLKDRKVNYIDFEVNWVSGLFTATQYDVALIGI